MSDGFIPPHGGYQKLLSYQKAEIVYDATVYFCDRYIDRRSRTHDQMVQAARSGKTQTSRHVTRRRGALLCLIMISISLIQSGCSDHSLQEQTTASGEALFLRHCAGCHPQGRNLLYPQKDLRRLTLAANGIATPEDIVKVMRNPGKGMTRFDRTTIPDDEARRIANYLLEAFK